MRRSRTFRAEQSSTLTLSPQWSQNSIWTLTWLFRYISQELLDDKLNFLQGTAKSVKYSVIHDQIGYDLNTIEVRVVVVWLPSTPHPCVNFSASPICSRSCTTLSIWPRLCPPLCWLLTDVPSEEGTTASPSEITWILTNLNENCRYGSGFDGPVDFERLNSTLTYSNKPLRKVHTTCSNRFHSLILQFAASFQRVNLQQQQRRIPYHFTPKINQFFSSPKQI